MESVVGVAVRGLEIVRGRSGREVVKRMIRNKGNMEEDVEEAVAIIPWGRGWLCYMLYARCLAVSSIGSDMSG